jgi:AcrR family transcriptional regulator
MSSDGWSRRRQRIALHVESIALERFARDGYHVVTFDDIAADAGMHVRTLFRHFPAKEDLFLAMPRRAIEYICEALRDVPGDMPLFESFAAAIDATSDLGPSERPLRMAWAKTLQDAPDLLPRVHGEVQMMLFEAVAVAVAKRLNESVGSLRVGVLASAIVGVLQHVWQRWLMEGAPGGSASDLVAEGFRHLNSATLHDADQRPTGQERA